MKTPQGMWNAVLFSLIFIWLPLLLLFGGPRVADAQRIQGHVMTVAPPATNQWVQACFPYADKKKDAWWYVQVPIDQEPTWKIGPWMRWRECPEVKKLHRDDPTCVMQSAESRRKDLDLISVLRVVGKNEDGDRWAVIPFSEPIGSTPSWTVPGRWEVCPDGFEELQAGN